MPKKRHTPEQIIDSLREVEVLLANCLTLPEFCRKIEVTALFTLPRATTILTPRVRDVQGLEKAQTSFLRRLFLAGDGEQ